MRLIVQIPCFNEQDTLARTVADIPRQIDGVDLVEVLIIDDGSTDRTVEVAGEAGVHHIIRHKANRGLAHTFATGIDACVRLGADIIVNTDGDNQYPGRFIPDLIQPILDGKAEIVVGDRQTAHNANFSPLKRKLQRLGSFVVRQISGTKAPDAVSGFRAISRNAALRLNIVSTFSYTIEMLIQAGNKRMAVASVPIETNAKTRDSRLFSSLSGFIWRSVTTMLRMYAMYQPLRTFFYIGCALSLVGAVPILRFLYLYYQGEGDGHIQSLVLGGVLLVMGLTTFMFGLIADLISFNRRLMETTLEKVRRLELAEPANATVRETLGDLQDRIRQVAAQDDDAVPGPPTESKPERKSAHATRRD